VWRDGFSKSDGIRRMYKSRPHVYLPEEIKNALGLHPVDNTYIQFSFERAPEKRSPRMIRITSENTQTDEQETSIHRLTDEYMFLKGNEDYAFQEYKNTQDTPKFVERLAKIKAEKLRIKENLITIFRGSSDFEWDINLSSPANKEQLLELLSDVEVLKIHIEELLSMKNILNQVHKDGLVNDEYYTLRKKELEKRLTEQFEVSNKIVQTLSTGLDQRSDIE
jgi:hypothetical protein